MAKVRIGHLAEAQIVQAVGVDYIDESEVLTPADWSHHIDKSKFKTPFVCGARDLYEALRRIEEGAAMIRTKGEAGTGDVAEAVKHARLINDQIQQMKHNVELMSNGELEVHAREHRVPIKALEEVARLGRLPVVNFAAGGIATPADAALMMQLGVDGVFVGSGIFKSSDPAKMASAIVRAVTSFNDPEALVEASTDVGIPMIGIPVTGVTNSWAGR
jgi:pyridoxal 5'-phosphate synthase pdxS subunit